MLVNTLESTYARSCVFLTSSPIRVALTWFPPTAYRLRPKRVLRSIKPVSRTTISAMITEIRINGATYIPFGFVYPPNGRVIFRLDSFVNVSSVTEI